VLEGRYPSPVQIRGLESFKKPDELVHDNSTGSPMLRLKQNNNMMLMDEYNEYNANNKTNSNVPIFPPPGNNRDLYLKKVRSKQYSLRNLK